MNLGEEKVFLYGMMKNITEERRQLTEMYFSLKERIDTLHKLEEKGIGEISTQGFIDLFNDREAQLKINNLRREAEYQKELAHPRYDKVAATFEQGQAERTAQREQAIQKAKAKADEEELVQQSLLESEQVKAQFEEEPVDLDLVKERTLKASQELMAQLQEAKTNKINTPEIIKENVIYNGRGRPPAGYVKPKKTKTKVVHRFKEKETTYLIVEILKENGIMKGEDVRLELEKLLDTEIPSNSFNSNILYRALKSDPKIERVSHGLYQYAK